MLPTGQSGKMAVKDHQQPTPSEIFQLDFTAVFIAQSKGMSPLSGPVAK
jgi:hypothetical protein